MEVVCSRCRAEYEFDETLIASRGTTVRCTGCGLQFRVYPEEGVLVDDRWLVVDPSDPNEKEQRFETLSQLQQAIVQGQVSARHLLSRAGRAPRPLSKILELQPLLRQRKSDVSQLGDEDRMSEVPDTLVDDISEDAIVPSNPPEPIHGYSHSITTLPPSSGSTSGSSPRIRSVLSPVVEGGPSSNGRGDSSSEGRHLEQKRRSTHQTLSSTPRALREAMDRVEEAPRAAAERHDGPNSESTGEGPEEGFEVGSEEGVTIREPFDPAASPEATRRALPSSPMEARISENDPFPGQMTPTPGALRAYRRVDTAPMSSVPGIPASRHARSGGIVLSVLLGGLAFLLFANRHRLGDLLATQDESKEETAEGPQEDPLLQQKLRNAQVVWLGQRLFGRSVDTADTERLSELHATLTASTSDPSWDLVNVLIAQGRVADARRAAGGLSPSASSAYTLALLDLAESSDSPPWAVIVERLKEASIGERGLFLARTAYIYALVESGQLARAQADFDALSRINGAQTSPLYEDLSAYLRAKQGLTQEKDEQDREDPPADHKPMSTRPSAPKEAAAPPPRAPPPPVESSVEDKVSPAAENPGLSPSLELKAAWADQMWGAGNRSEALVVYRSIVAQLGTQHPVGNRAAKRIREFEDMRKNETQVEEE